MKKDTGNALENLDINVILDRKPIAFDLESIAKHFEGKSILITGAGGSIGSSLAELLADFNPASLILLEHHENSLYLLRQRLGSNNSAGETHYVLADVRDRQKIANIFAKFSPQIVFHLAAYKHVHIGEENPDQVVSTNIFGTLNIAEEVLRTRTQRMVFPSTDKAVNPPSVYGASKRSVELLLRQKSKETPHPVFAPVRLVNTIGAQGGVVRVFAEQILAERPLTLTHEAMTRYWISMQEATLFIAQAACFDRVDGILLLDMGEPVNLKTVAERLWQYLGSPGSGLQYTFIGMRPGERLEEELNYDFEELKPTSSPGILEIMDSSGISQSADDFAEKLDALKLALKQGDNDKLREELFRLAKRL